MTSGAIDIPGKEVLVTKKPFNFFLTLIILIGLGIVLVAIIFSQKLNFRDSLSCFFLFAFIAIIFYAKFGQYLAVIMLYEHRIDINYIFPGHKSLVFRFARLVEVDHKYPFRNGRARWYVVGRWLYLKNEKGEVCQFKYNINNSDDRRLVEELRRKCV